jgi:hypothetical protein
MGLPTILGLSSGTAGLGLALAGSKLLKPPPVPPLPPLPETTGQAQREIAEASAAESARALELRRRRGRGSTILSGLTTAVQGGTSNVKQLLGI